MSDDDVPGDPKPLDVIVGAAPTRDREGLHVIRVRDHEDHRRIELGEMRPTKPDHALPPNSELVRLSPREDGPAFDVEVIVPRQLSGPAQVATPAYRSNWDATFDDDSDADVN